MITVPKTLKKNENTNKTKGKFAWLSELAESKVNIPFHYLCDMHDKTTSIKGVASKRFDAWIAFTAKNPKYYLRLLQSALQIQALARPIIAVLQKTHSYIESVNLLPKIENYKNNISKRAMHYGTTEQRNTNVNTTKCKKKRTKSFADMALDLGLFVCLLFLFGPGNICEG